MRKILKRSVVLTYAVVVATLTVFVGCASYVRTTSTTTYPDGREEVIESVARQPRYPLGGARASVSNNYAEASTSGAQSQAGISREKWIGLSRIAMYGLCTIITLFGAFVMFFGERLGLSRLECNRDGAIIMGAGIGSVAVFQLVEASAPVMKWVIPIAFIGVLAYFGIMKWKKSKKED